MFMESESERDGHAAAVNVNGDDDIGSDSSLADNYEETISDSSSESSVSSAGTMDDRERRERKSKRKAEMLKLALHAISTFKESRKRSQKRPKTAVVSAEAKSSSGEQDPGSKPTNQHVPFVHPLLREILNPDEVQINKGQIVLPLLPPPLVPPLIGPELDYYEEGDSDDEYNPDDLTGHGDTRCQICCEVFPSQSLADIHMTTYKHRKALETMSATILNYCDDISAIVKLRDKLKARKEKVAAKQHAAAKGRLPENGQSLIAPLTNPGLQTDRKRKRQHAWKKDQK